MTTAVGVVIGASVLRCAEAGSSSSRAELEELEVASMASHVSPPPTMPKHMQMTSRPAMTASQAFRLVLFMQNSALTLIQEGGAEDYTAILR
jgi:hypothetical protein